MPEPSEETETFEHIPWNRLTLAPAGSSGRWMYVAASLLLVATVAAVVARTVWPSSVAGLETTVETSIVQVSAAEPTSVPPDSLYSEADLMATVVPSEIERRVGVVAERYVRAWAAGAPDEGWAYVEWSAQGPVDDLGDGRFRTVTVFQLLVGSEGEAHRLPVQAVEVIIRVDSDAVAVEDLPRPVEPIDFREMTPLVEAEPVPDHVATGALDAVSAWGPGTVVESGRDSGYWRLVVEVELAEGIRRLVSVSLDGEGRPIGG